MTTEFIFFADLVLLLRVRSLFSDKARGWRGWLLKGLIEVLALGLFEPHPFLIGAGLTSVVLNVALAFWDTRAQERYGGRLFFGVAQLVVLSVWFSAAGGVRFRPEVRAVGDWLAAWSTVAGEVLRLADRHGLKMLLGLLLAANEANLLVRWVLVHLQIKPENPAAASTGIDAGEFARGRVIGLLERVLIYSFVLGGQFGAIGFTLGAKGLTRFKEMENRGFAEYVLIGTLLSSSIAMAIGVWVKFSP